MELTTITDKMESLEFSARLGIASGFGTFLDILTESQPFKDLQIFLEQGEDAERQLLAHIKQLGSTPIDERYENPNDTALAAYLWALRDTLQIGLAVLLLRDTPNLGWARKATEILSHQFDCPQCNGTGEPNPDKPDKITCFSIQNDSPVCGLCGGSGDPADPWPCKVSGITMPAPSHQYVAIGHRPRLEVLYIGADLEEAKRIAMDRTKSLPPEDGKTSMVLCSEGTRIGYSYKSGGHGTDVDIHRWPIEEKEKNE